jgi:hypothetical protein
MQRLHQSQAIDRSTLVWNSAGWRQLDATGFGLCEVDLELPVDERSAPPSACAWMLACAPLLCIAAAVLMRLHLKPWSTGLLWVTVVLHLVLAEADLFFLQRAGIDTSRMGPPAAVPLYLSLRARTLREQPTQHAVWWFAFTSGAFALALSISH